MKISEAVVYLTANKKDLQKGLKDGERATRRSANNMQGYLDQVNKKVKQIGDQFTQLGKKMTIRGGMGLLASGLGIGAFMKQSAELQSQLIDVSTLFSDSKADIGGFTDEILNLSRVVPKSTKDLSAGLYQIKSAGIEAGDMFDFLKVASVAATAGVSEVEPVIRALTKTLEGYGMESKQVLPLANKFFKTIEEGQVNLTELAESLPTVTSASATAGLSIDEMLGAFSAGTKILKDHRQTAVGLAGMLRSIGKASDEQQKKAKELGFEFNQQALQAKGLVGFLKDMKEALKGTNVSIREFFRREQGFRLANALLNESFETLIDNIDEMSNSQGALNRAFQKQMEALKTQAILAWNNITALVKSIGTELIPEVTDMTKSFRAFVSVLNDRFNQATPEARKRIAELIMRITKLSAGFLGLVTVAGLVSLGLGLIIKSATLVIGFLSLLTSPIVLLIGLIGLLYTAWENDWGNIRTLTENAVDEIKNKWDELKDWWDNSDLKNIIEGSWDDIVKIWQSEELTLPEKTIKTVNIIVTSVGKLLDSIISWWLDQTIKLTERGAKILGLNPDELWILDFLKKLEKIWDNEEITFGEKVVKSIELIPGGKWIVDFIGDIKDVWTNEKLTFKEKTVKSLKLIPGVKWISEFVEEIYNVWSDKKLSFGEKTVDTLEIVLDKIKVTAVTTWEWAKGLFKGNLTDRISKAFGIEKTSELAKTTELLQKYGEKLGFSAEQLTALAKIESDFQNVESDKSTAVGPLQITETAISDLEESGKTIENSLDTLEGRIEAAVKYLALLRDKYNLTGKELIGAYYAGIGRIQSEGITDKIVEDQISSEEYVNRFNEALGEINKQPKGSLSDKILGGTIEAIIEISKVTWKSKQKLVDSLLDFIIKKVGKEQKSKGKDKTVTLDKKLDVAINVTVGLGLISLAFGAKALISAISTSVSSLLIGAKMMGASALSGLIAGAQVTGAAAAGITIGAILSIALDPTIDNFEEWKTNFKEGIKILFSEDFWNDIWTIMQDEWDKKWNEMLDIKEKIKNAVKGPIEKALAPLKNALKILSQKAKEQNTSVWTPKGFATGGKISGPGSSISDSILARLSDGEFVVNAEATSRFLPLLQAINSGSLPGFANGGIAGFANGTESPINIESAKEFLGTATTGLNNTARQMFNVMSMIFDRLFNVLVEQLKERFPDIANELEKVINETRLVFDDLKGSLKETTTQTNYLGSILKKHVKENPWKKARKAINKFAKGVGGALTNISDILDDLGLPGSRNLRMARDRINGINNLIQALDKDSKVVSQLTDSFANIRQTTTNATGSKGIGKLAGGIAGATAFGQGGNIVGGITGALAGAGMINPVWAIGSQIIGGLMPHEPKDKGDKALKKRIKKYNQTLKEWGASFKSPNVWFKDTANWLESLFGGEDWKTMNKKAAKRGAETAKSIINSMKQTFSTLGNQLGEVLFRGISFDEFSTFVGQRLQQVLMESVMQMERVKGPLQKLSAYMAEAVKNGLTSGEITNIKKLAKTVFDSVEPFSKVAEKISKEFGLAEESAKGIGEALRNVPSGFKIALTRFSTAEGVIPSAASGGFVAKTGLVNVHAGEVISNPSQKQGDTYDITIEGPIYGVDDLDRKIKQSINQTKLDNSLSRYGTTTGGDR